MKPDSNINAVHQTQLPTEIFWLEHFRLAVQSAQLTRSYIDLLSKYALWGSRELMPRHRLNDDE